MSKVVETLVPYHHRRASQKKAAASHTFANANEKFMLPAEKEVEMLLFDAIDADVRNDIPFFLHENPSPIFRMFLECNFATPEYLTSDEIATIAAVIHQSCARFFPEDVSVNTPRLFEAILLLAQPRALCASRHAFSELIKKVPRIQTSETIFVVDGRVQIDADVMDVIWHTVSPPNGAYQCVVDSEDVVRVIATGDPSFVNPRVFSTLYKNVLRTGMAPEDSVRLSDELLRSGPWYHTSKTTFAVDDNTYFLNSVRDTHGRIDQHVRFVFPQIYVGVEEALYMRESIIEALILTFGAKHSLAPVGWSDVIKNECYLGYNGIGLRVFGAHRASNCERCKGRRVRDGDLRCPALGCNLGKIDEGCPYDLHSVYLDGIRSPQLESNYALKSRLTIERTSIRTIFKSRHPQWMCYAGCPKFGDTLKTVVKEDGVKTYKIKGKDATFKQEAKIGCTATDVFDRDIFAIFEKHIRARFVRQYRNLRVCSVRKSEKDVYYIDVAGEGQHWCINLLPPADHEHNKIFFQCDRDGICVRCRCTEATVAGRNKGMCKDFKSSIKPLDTSERTRLFPDSLHKRSLTGATSTSKRSRAQP